MMVEAGANLFIDIVMDLLVAKGLQWRNDVNLRERLAALQTFIQVKKIEALHALLADPWAGGAAGKYYNVYIRIKSTTTTAIGGGHAVVRPGSPRPELVRVIISSADANKVLSEDEAVKVPGLAEGATGAVMQLSDTQFVVYSEAIE
jgi:hypothetical protein